MKNFQLVKAANASSAITLQKRDKTAMFIAGGTNLVDLMKKGVLNPEKLIDVNGIALAEIEQINGRVIIGSLAKNSQVSESDIIKKSHPLLSLAIAAGASQQIRHMASVGGNMLQRTRCAYFYNTDLPCNKRQSKTGCGAIGGHNRMHAIFGASEMCIAVHPSDMCIALSALDATVMVEGPKGKRTIPFTLFHRLPGEHPEKDNTLLDNEFITGVSLEENNFNRYVHYLKIRDRSSYAFALVSVAVALDIDMGTIKAAKIAMGGVAHKPWRLSSAESFLKGKQALPEVFKTAATLSMEGARGYGDNDFKLKLAPNAIIEALTIAAAK